MTEPQPWRAPRVEILRSADEACNTFFGDGEDFSSYSATTSVGN